MPDIYGHDMHTGNDTHTYVINEAVIYIIGYLNKDFEGSCFHERVLKISMLFTRTVTGPIYLHLMYIDIVHMCQWHY